MAGRVHLIGDAMYDALLEAVVIAKRTSTILDRLGLKPQEYILTTVHRAENTDQPQRLANIVKTLTDLARIGHRYIHGPNNSLLYIRSNWTKQYYK